MIEKLLERLKSEQHSIFIQTHNFPDPDAVASAFGLQQLFKLNGIQCRIIYDGGIQRMALIKMIKDFTIDISPSGSVPISEEDKIILVDGCKRNKNVTNLPGKEIAVIDHHEGNDPGDIEFVDIRPEAGACASIISSYYKRLGFETPRDAATVLLAGLFRDTDSLTRGVSSIDVEAYVELFKRADNFKVSSIVINNISMSDLSYYSIVINNLKIKGDIAFCYIEEECNQNLLGILGDFILTLGEIKFTALFADNNQIINISFRNESPDISAAAVMREVVAGIGSGGGHIQMAGGVIDEKKNFDSQKMFDKIVAIINR